MCYWALVIVAPRMFRWLPQPSHFVAAASKKKHWEFVLVVPEGKNLLPMTVCAPSAP